MEFEGHFDQEGSFVVEENQVDNQDDEEQPISDKLAKQFRDSETGPDANELYGMHSASIQHSAILRNMSKSTEKVERFEAEGEEWILDHTGIKRKPFKVMHREIKALIADKIVVMHNLCKDFAYLRLTRHDCVRTLDTSLFKMF
jgi:hypothetical protein